MNDLQKMYIVYVVHAISDISGGMRVIFEQANSLKKIGHNVEIWSSGQEGLPYFDNEVTVRKYHPDSLNSPDVVVMADTVFIRDAKLHRNKKNTYLLLQHDNEWVSEVTGVPIYPLLNGNEEYFEEKHCEILVVSSWLKEIVKQKYNLGAHLALNGVRSDIFYPDKPMVNARGPLMLYFYDPQAWKGSLEILQAMSMVRQEIPNAAIGIVSKYIPETPRVDGVSFGVPYPVLFFNRPNQNDLASIYSSAAVFVSGSWKEGFCLPALEAMACKTPVVTTDSGGNRDFSVPETTALVVPAQRPLDLAGAIIRILGDAKLKNKLVSEAYKTAQSFNWEKTAESLEDIFNERILKI